MERQQDKGAGMWASREVNVGNKHTGETNENKGYLVRFSLRRLMPAPSPSLVMYVVLPFLVWGEWGTSSKGNTDCTFRQIAGGQQNAFPVSAFSPLPSAQNNSRGK